MNKIQVWELGKGKSKNTHTCEIIFIWIDGNMEEQRHAKNITKNTRAQHNTQLFAELNFAAPQKHQLSINKHDIRVVSSFVLCLHHFLCLSSILVLSIIYACAIDILTLQTLSSSIQFNSIQLPNSLNPAPIFCSSHKLWNKMLTTFLLTFVPRKCQT